MGNKDDILAPLSEHWCTETETLACGHTTSTTWLIGNEPLGPASQAIFCGFCQDWQPSVEYEVKWL